MRNPLRSEQEAFNFLLVTLVSFAIIAAASLLGGPWAGVPVTIVVAPALNTPLRTWMSDEDPARAEAQRRLEASVARLRDGGVAVRGEIGDGDPLQAIEDALRTFGADEVILSTHPEGRSHWLERNVVGQARERFDVPITHVVVDLEAQPGTLTRDESQL